MMKQCIDKMIVILPFEKDYYKNKWNWEVEYVGHPLVEVVEEKRFGVSGLEFGVVDIKNNHRQQTTNNKLIALLPGSRKQEISKKLPIMLQLAKSFPGYV